MSDSPSHADYVVVGTGSAGAIIAARLSERSSNQVVALEAGGADKKQEVHIPAAFSKLFQSELDWKVFTTPQPELGDRKIFYPRGKMLGGSSSMNAMMWVRGFAADYDGWAKVAGDSWSFANVVEYFKRIESVEGAQEPDEGRTGPQAVSNQRSPRGWTADFLTAVQNAGFTRERANLPQPDGFTQTMVCQKRGARASTADSYLRPAAKRSNLTVLTNAHATKVLFDGRRAVGVQYLKDGVTQTVMARKEVILSGGALNTPQLLMLSGIGDQEQLRRHGIDVMHHLPEVGRNLQDHLVCLLGYAVESGSLFAAEKPREIADYLIRRRGMLTSNVGEAYGFVRSRPDLELPDIEIIFGPAPFYDEGIGTPVGHGIGLGPILVDPRSHGTVTLASADPTTNPLVDPKYLSDSDGVDRAAMRNGLRIAHRIFSSEPLASKTGKLLQPKQEQAELADTLEDALTAYSHTLYHPTSTCRMGADEASVVTPDLKVRGVEGLRVADASVMPRIVRGHTHAPTMVIGERAADLLKG
ncbi:GMC family oxidoreductase [Jongsikchunia kroppenstedtii]|uniref:GMC family oxidoreductase n=1 Tax=Jongsikchunia kroppenstedtii TaxID=1121721 RepID=UPI0003690D87|nr:GMC family oxidoreductase N-terminal domain-containing protein [Jongsikchunia kroppenstedtii]